VSTLKYPGLSIAMSGVAKEVHGLDLNEDMIRFATERAWERGIYNAKFITRDASDLSLFKAREFSVAVTSMSVHQFDAELAIQVLKEMKRIA